MLGRRVPSFLRSTLCLLLALAALLPLPDAHGAQALTFSPCQLEHPLRLRTLAAECAELWVPEQPGFRASRSIPLRIARLRAVSRRSLKEPLVVLAGGPGLAATTFYASVEPAFEPIRRERDIVLIDQRGTGGSNALSCALDEDMLYRAGAPELRAQTERCLRVLAQSANVAWYTTSLAVSDLERVRVALGYEQIDLYGSSYGTRVAQQYLRRFPQRVRAVILDGVVPPQLALGPATALDAEAALQNIFARCARLPACREQFGDPAESYRAVREHLARAPVAVSIPDPTSGDPQSLQFGPYHLATVLRLASYAPEEAALLPLLLHQAARGNYAALAAQFLLVTRAYEDVLAFGMHNSVVCTEDVPFYGDAIDRARLAATYLGTSQLDGLLAICSVWPRGPIDADLHAQLHSDTPVLLLSGSDDPVTPPRYAEQARAGLTHSLHIVLQGFGHGQLLAPCVDRLMASFLERGTVAGLDTSCIRDATPLAFFVSPAGPSP